MNEQLAQRLSSAITAVMGQFKVGAAGAPYDDLTLTDSALISWLAKADEEGIEPIQKDVGASLGLPKTTMTSAVKRLKARGLIEQTPGARDGRSKAVSLTPAGLRLGASLKNAQIRASAAILEALSSDEQLQLITLLETVVKDLLSSDKPAG